MAAKLQAVYAALDQGSNEAALKLLKGALKKATRGVRTELLALRGVALACEFANGSAVPVASYPWCDTGRGVEERLAASQDSRSWQM